MATACPLLSLLLFHQKQVKWLYCAHLGYTVHTCSVMVLNLRLGIPFCCAAALQAPAAASTSSTDKGARGLMVVTPHNQAYNMINIH